MKHKDTFICFELKIAWENAAFMLTAVLAESDKYLAKEYGDINNSLFSF